LFDEGSNSPAFNEWPQGFGLDESGNQERVLLATFQIHSHLPKPYGIPTKNRLRHFDPIGTEFVVKPGRVNHSLSKSYQPSAFGHQLLNLFKLGCRSRVLKSSKADCQLLSAEC
jgi:hypothetical protein